MSYRMADICPAPNNPSTLMADLDSLGAVAAGLYVVNLSIPSCELPAPYVQEVVARGYGVLPIIVPGDNPPADLDLVIALKLWGVPPAPVAFDIETFSSPDAGWLARKVQELVQAQYFPGMYGDAGHQAAYGAVPFLWRWLADWTFSPFIAAGYQATQWTDRAVGVSGTRYDLSEVEDDLIFWGRQRQTVPPITPLPPPPPADEMPAEVSFPAVHVEPVC